MTANSPVPYRIEIPPAVIDDLRARLRRTRFPNDFANGDWGYGFETAYLKELVRYWTEEFDWSAIEDEINRYAHYRVELDSILVHYMHIRGKAPDSPPLLLNHGWPWTFWDYHRLIGPLTDPVAYGGEEADSFDLIIPSLPGHGFSSPLDQVGWNVHTTADMEVKLMTEVLGHERFFAAGGDWGAIITTQLGHKYPDLVKALYCHMPMQLSFGLPDHPDAPPGLAHLEGFPLPTEYDESSERGWAEKNAHFFAIESAYASVQMTKPQTLAAALNDSPAGLMAWIIEKRRTWADTGGDLESVWTKDDLCTTATIYWATETPGTSARFYRELQANPWTPSHDGFPVVAVPSALGIYLNEVLLMPRKWCEAYYNVQQYSIHDRGGHFAPAEVPGTWLNDVVPFFRGYR